MMNLVVGLAVFCIILFLGFKVIRRIPKGIARRNPKTPPANQTAGAPEGEPGDWFSATFGGGLSGYPGLDIIFKAAEGGDGRATSMANAFLQMSSDGGKLMILKELNALALLLKEEGATSGEILKALEAAMGTVKPHIQPSRGPTFTVGPRRDRFGVKEARKMRRLR